MAYVLECPWFREAGGVSSQNRIGRVQVHGALLQAILAESITGKDEEVKATIGGKIVKGISDRAVNMADGCEGMEALSWSKRLKAIHIDRSSRGMVN